MLQAAPDFGFFAHGAVAVTGGAYPALIRHVFDVLAAGLRALLLQMISLI